MVCVQFANINNFFKETFFRNSASLRKKTETALQRCSQEKLCSKYAANLQKNTHAKMQFQQICKALRFRIGFRQERSSVNLLDIFRKPFPKNTSGGILLETAFIEIHMKFSGILNFGLHISPQFCGISYFSCDFLILPSFSGSYDQFFFNYYRGKSRTAATSKMERFVIIVNGLPVSLKQHHQAFEEFGVLGQLDSAFPNQKRSWSDSENREFLPECYYDHHCYSFSWPTTGPLLLFFVQSF